jgi:hypothetical protein
MECDRAGTGPPRFEETQQFSGRWRWGVAAVVGTAAALAVAVSGPDPLTLLLAVGVPAGLVAATLLATLRTTVESDGVHVRFTPFHRRPRVVEFADVAAVERVTVSALGDYGGVGIRRDGDSWAYLVGSGDALRFVRADQPDVVVVSSRIEAFHRAVRDARDDAGR